MISLISPILTTVSALMLATAGLPYGPAPLLEVSSASTEPWFAGAGVVMTSSIDLDRQADEKTHEQAGDIDQEPAPVPVLSSTPPNGLALLFQTTSVSPSPFRSANRTPRSVWYKPGPQSGQASVFCV